MRNVIVCFALIAGWAFAQNAPAQSTPEKTVHDIRDVQLGMSRDHVLAGLGDRYDLTRIDDPKRDTARSGDEYWMVFPKGEAKSLLDLDRESGAIRFIEGKARSVEIDLYSSRTGESTRFAERLFWLLYNRADPPASPNKLCGVELRIGMSKDEVFSKLGKNCELLPIAPSRSFRVENQMGTSSVAWCVSAPFACAHTIWFEGETLSAVKLDKFYTESNPRYATLPVELRDRHDDKGEDLKVLFTLGGQDFSISISKRPGQPDSVRMEQSLCCC